MKKKVCTILKKNKRNIKVFFLLFIISFLVYFKIFSVGFLSDDFHMLSIAKDVSPWWKYFGTNIIGENIGSSYGPMMNIFFELEYTLFGLNPFGYHIMSLLLFSGTAFVLFKMVYKLTRKFHIGVASAIVFLFLPNHVESLAWIAVLPHLLATFLFLLCIYFYIQFLSKNNKKYYVLSLLFIILSLFTKEIGITFIGVLFLLELLYGKSVKRTWKSIKEFIIRIFVRFVPFVLFLISYFFARSYATGTLFGYYAKPELEFNISNMWHMFLNICSTMFFSFPNRVYAVNIIEANILLSSIIGIIFCIFLLWRSKKYRKVLVFFMISFIGVSLPYLDLLINPINNEGERYSYLLSVFFAPIIVVSIAIILKKFKSKRELIYIAIIALSIFYIPQIQSKLLHWQQASTMVNQILESAKELEFEDNTFTYFVGIPDNVAGAQVLRNASKLSFELFSEQENIQGERVVLFTYFDEQTINTPILLEKNDSFYRLYTKEDQRFFTGFPEVERDDAVFELENFSSIGHTGTAIHIIPKEENNYIRYVYYSDGELHIIN
jgi:protein O-mannosyl-transferase